MPIPPLCSFPGGAGPRAELLPLSKTFAAAQAQRNGSHPSRKDFWGHRGSLSRWSHTRTLREGGPGAPQTCPTGRGKAAVGLCFVPAPCRGTARSSSPPCAGSRVPWRARRVPRAVPGPPRRSEPGAPAGASATSPPVAPGPPPPPPNLPPSRRGRRSPGPVPAPRTAALLPSPEPRRPRAASMWFRHRGLQLPGRGGAGAGGWNCFSL